MGLQDMIRQMMTESDNRTHDIFRYLALLCVLVGLTLEIYVIAWREPGQPFDFINFGTGVGLILAGAGTALKLKTETIQTQVGTQAQNPPKTGG